MSAFIVLLSVVFRVISHFSGALPNFSPVAATALFGGTYLNKKWALALPILIMVLSDLVIGFDGFFSRAYVYGSFILTGFIGLWIRNHKSFTNVLLGAFASSVLFFLITNFGVWAHSSLYDKTINGLMQSYLMGLPFFRNTLLGDLFYTGVFFGGFELASHYLRRVNLNKATT